MPDRLMWVALRTSLLYAFFSALWIALSDRVVVAIWSDPDTIGRIATYKGWVFVVITALLLYGTLRGQLQRWGHESEKRREAEGTLRRYELMASHTRDIILFMQSGSGHILEVNTAAVDTYGYSRAELLALTINDLRSTGTQSLTAGQMAEADARGILFETVHRRKDGSTFPVEVSSRGATIDDIRTLISVVRDITERKRMEEALRWSHEELEQKVLERTEALRRQASLLELAYNAIIVRDLNGTITFWNARAEELYGFTRDEALGQVTHTLLQTHFGDTLEKRMTILTAEGRWEGELTHTKKDGGRLTVLSRQALQRDEAGNPVAIMEIDLDVTEQRHVEEQLRQAQKMEALGTLSGGIAHDFNNILAAIIGFTELVAGHVDRGSRDAHALERVLGASMRARELVKQMLMFSRKAEQEKKPLHLDSTIRETINLIRPSTPSTISVNVSVHAESGLILADHTQMQQVLMNLCTNATHAMHEKGGSLDIDVREFNVSPSDGNPHGIKPGLYVKLTVRDTGIGMSPDITARIFDPFFTTKKPGEGTGLGLSVVHGIVRQHDGYITVESEPDKGSTFTVYLPQIAGELETATVGDAEIPTGSERILFVDDEEALVEMGENILAELGYEVTSRASSREALALFRLDPSRFDLVITDQTMPEMTGIELTNEILAIRADMPIIMCTGFSYTVDADLATTVGIKAFVMKPLTKREIARTVRDVLDD